MGDGIMKKAAVLLDPASWGFLIPDPANPCHSEGGAATDHAGFTAASAPTEESGGWAHGPVGHDFCARSPARQAAPLPNQILRSALLLPREGRITRAPSSE